MTPEELQAWFKYFAHAGGIALVTAAAVIFAIKHFFSSYITEKGKNVATREDIADITNKIEGIRTQYAVLVEELKARHQLRLAAIDRRLEVHQEAFTLWRELMSAMHGDGVREAATNCDEWWGSNCIYLEKGVREGFVSAYRSALNHQMLLENSRQDRTNAQNSELVRENWSRITSFPDLLFEAVQLPKLTELEKKQLHASDDQMNA
jgi:hypothetical protein